MSPEIESRNSDFIVSMSKTQEALKYLLTMPRIMNDARAKMTLFDCLELFENAISHVSMSTSRMNPNDVRKWFSATMINHKTCLNGFKHYNFSKLFVDMLVEHKPLASTLSTTHNHGFVLLAEGEGTHANLVVAQDGSGDFSTITEAIKLAENQMTGTNRFIIYVKAGIYKENIIIMRYMTNLILIGDGIDATVITNDKSIYDGLLTSNTATVRKLPIHIIKYINNLILMLISPYQQLSMSELLPCTFV